MTRRVEESVEDRGGMEPVTWLGRRAILACPLTVKDKPAGVLLTRRQSGFSERDRSLFASLASQLSMGMENARLYHQLDGLFRASTCPRTSPPPCSPTPSRPRSAARSSR